MSTEAEKVLEQVKSKQVGIKKRKFYDRIARYVVTVGGFGIILCIIAILFFIGIETVPLWKNPEKKLTADTSAEKLIEAQSPGKQKRVLGLGTEEYREQAFIIGSDGSVKFFTLDDKLSLTGEHQIALEDSTEFTSIYSSKNNSSYSLATDTGSIKPFEISFNIKFDNETNRTIVPELLEGEAFKISENKIVEFALEENPDNGSKVAAVYTDQNQLLLYSETVKESFLGDAEKTTNTVDLTDQINNEEVTSILIDSFLENLYVATKKGNIYNWSVSSLDNPELKHAADATNDKNTAVTALGFLLGDRSLIVGDAKGNVSVWFETAKDGKTNLTKIHTLPPLEKAIDKLSDSPRDRSFTASD
ncbi:MAG: hypothetical protein ACRENO_02895, partial [Thermodesulfobacteriota bacterium]